MVLEGTTALITGAARGIGQATAVELAAAGVDIIGVDLDLQDLEKTKIAVEQRQKKFKAISCDITDRFAVQNRLKEIGSAGFGFDILVNNAGVMVTGYFAERNFEVWQKAIDVNLTALMNITHLSLPYLMKKEKAHIVNVASIAGKFGPEGVAAYAASKHGVVGFSSALRFELKKHNIGVSCICPSQVKTRMSEGVSNTFLTPVMQPQDVAKAIKKAIEKNLAEVYVPSWQRLLISILPSLAPGFARWFASATKVSKGWLHAGNAQNH